MKNVLIISPEPWGDNYVSKHHYAKELAKRGVRVCFLNKPSDQNKVEKVTENLFVIDYKPSVRGLARLPVFLSAYFIKREVKKIERIAGVVFDTIWNFDSSRFFNLERINNKLKICHIVDMAEDIQRPLLAKTSDICFCTSDFIAEELKPFNKKVYKIHHGYSIPVCDQEVEEQYDSSMLQVGYVGNLSRACIDWDLILELIERNPKVQFNFIGGYKHSNLSNKEIEEGYLKRLKNKGNVVLLGQKQSHLIPNYLKKFDVLICAYKLDGENDVKQHSNLHKTMEYIGSGNVTISTYSDEYKDKRALLEMIDVGGDLVGLFEEVIQKIDYYNSDSLREMRINFAYENSYCNQVTKIEGILKIFKNEG